MALTSQAGQQLLEQHCSSLGSAATVKRQFRVATALGCAAMPAPGPAWQLW